MNTSASRTTSIRRRLLAFLIVPVALALGVGSIADLVSTEAPIREAYDQALSDAAIALALNVRVDAQGRIEARVPPEALNLLRTDLNDQVYFKVASSGGVVIAGDPDLPAAAAQPANPAHESVSFRGKSVRLATYRTRTRAGTVLVTVAETLNKRIRIQERLWSTALWTDVAELAAVLALVWLGVRLALKPLDDLGERIARQSPRDLQAIATGNTPLELVGVLQRLNVLLATVAEISQAERRFIESAAHQLRTPLAGLLAQLELLAEERSLADAHQQAQLALAAAQRLTHTTQQLLTLSRAEHGAHLQGQTQPVDLVALATASVSSHLARAQAAGLDLGAELEPVTIDGVGWLLSEALDNLIGNALTYTQRGAVTVRMGVRDAVPFLEVVDSGIGIPPAERAKVLSRFYRGEGSRGVGSGLGLAIVQEVAEQHGATLTISEGLAGLGTCVRLDFPRPNPST